MTNPPLHSPSALIATWFGIGYLPFAPGTWGSVTALAIAWIVSSLFGITSNLILISIIFFAGIWASGEFQKYTGVEDPSSVVVDEVVGQWLTVVFFPSQFIYYIIGFFLFRVFDIWKPWPVNWVDQKMKGGVGIMMDDIFAAAYSIGVLFIIDKLNVIY